MLRTLFLMAAILGMAVQPAEAQQNNSPKPGPQQPMLRVPAHFAGQEGVTPQFKVQVNSKDVKAVRVKSPKDDLLVLVVLDLTGDITLIEALRRAWTEQLSVLPANFWFGVFKAQEGLQVLQDPGPDRQLAVNAVQQYATAGKAGMLDSLETALSLGDRLQEKSQARVVVLYLTDSNIYNYREDYSNPVVNASDSRDLSRRFPDQIVNEKMQRLGDSLSAKQTPLYFVHLQYRADAINEAYQRGLQKLAADSGGLGSFSRSLGDIPDTLSTVLQAIRNQWSVTVPMPPGKAKQISVSLEVPEQTVTFRQNFSRSK